MPIDCFFAKLTRKLPVVAVIGKFAIPSFGLFLALSFLVGTFLVWRLARAWDFNEEKILDLTLLSFFGGLLGARIYFSVQHLEFFISNPIRFFLINLYPGFSFWGGLILGSVTFYFFSKRLKLDFWQVADIAAIAFLGSLVLGNIGCFLGGCGVGRESSMFFAVKVAGLVGNRIPVQLLESLLIFWAFRILWPKAKKFHTHGKILALSLVYLGLIKIIVEPLRDPKTYQDLPLTGYVLSFLMVALGVVINYKLSRRNFYKDIRSLPKVFKGLIFDSNSRRVMIAGLQKSWYNNTTHFLYNKRVELSWRLKSFSKLLRKIHVKPTPKNIR